MSPEQLGVTCSDTANPTDPDAWRRSAEALDVTAGGFGPVWTWNTSACAGWPAQGIRVYRGPFDVKPAHPLLVIGNTHDPATPLAGAKAGGPFTRRPAAHGGCVRARGPWPKRLCPAGGGVSAP